MSFELWEPIKEQLTNQQNREQVYVNDENEYIVFKNGEVYEIFCCFRYPNPDRICASDFEDVSRELCRLAIAWDCLPFRLHLLTNGRLENMKPSDISSLRESVDYFHYEEDTGGGGVKLEKMDVSESMKSSLGKIAQERKHRYFIELSGKSSRVTFHKLNKDQVERIKSMAESWGLGDKIDESLVWDALNIKTLRMDHSGKLYCDSNPQNHRITVTDIDGKVIWESEGKFKIKVFDAEDAMWFDPVVNPRRPKKNMLLLKEECIGLHSRYLLDTDGTFNPEKLMYRKADMCGRFNMIGELYYDEICTFNSLGLGHPKLEKIDVVLL